MTTSHLRTRSTRRTQEVLAAYSLLAPALLGMLVFLLLPILVVLWLSTQSWDLISPARFVGLDNFGAVLGDGRFVRSLGVTALFVVVAIPVQTVLGLVLGAVLSWRLPGTSAFRLVLLLPWVCAPLAIGVVWRWVLAPSNGVVASLLGHRITWLDDPSLILWIVVLVTVWSNVGYVALFYAAGISAIPRETFEAAEIDGASPLRRFVAITVPLVRPTTYFVLITGSIGAFQTFDTAYALAPNGGPERAADLVVGRIYYSAFGSFEFGSAAAASLVLFLLIGGVTLLQHRILGRRTTHELA